MTQRYENLDKRLKGYGVLLGTAALVLLAGCSSSVGGSASFAAAGASQDGGTQPSGSASSGDSAPPGSTPSVVATSPVAATSSAAPKARPEPKLVAKVPGWQPVRHPARKIAYDAPPNWKVDSASMIIGFVTTHGKQMAMSAASDYKRGYCPGHSGSSRAGAGVAASRGSDLGRAARAAARDWGQAAYEDGVQDATMKLSAPQALHIARVHAVRVTATVTVPKPGKCGSPGGIVDAVAISGGGSSGIFIVYADMNVKGGAPSRVINEMLGSVRRIP